MKTVLDNKVITTKQGWKELYNESVERIKKRDAELYKQTEQNLMDKITEAIEDGNKYLLIDSSNQNTWCVFWPTAITKKLFDVEKFVKSIGLTIRQAPNCDHIYIIEGWAD